MEKIRSSKAFSLVELMIVVSLMLIVGLALTNLFLTTQKTFKHTDSRIKARQEASLILRTIEKELRQTSQGSDDFESIEYANEGKLIFYANIDNDEKPEKVTYELNDSTITKTVTQTSNDSVPWEFDGPTSKLYLTKSVKADDPTPLFTFYEYLDTQLSQLPLNMADREKVKIIKVSVSIILPSSNREDQLETEVYLRNKNDPL